MKFKFTSVKNIYLTAIMFKMVFILIVGGAFFLTSGNNKYLQANSEPIISSFYAWDGQNYLGICRGGYLIKEEPYPSSIRYFAFLPGQAIMNCASIAVWGAITGSNDNNTQLFGPIVLNIFIFIGLCFSIKYYLDLYHPEFGDGLKYYILITFLIFPFSFFIHFNYTESIFLPLTFLALIALKLKEFKYFGLIGFVLSLIRITSIPMAAIMYLTHINESFTFKFKNLASESVNFIKNSFYFLPFGFGALITWVLFYVKYGSFNLFFLSQTAYYARRDTSLFLQEVGQDLSGRKTYWDTNYDWSRIIEVTGFNFYNVNFRYYFLILLPFIFAFVASLFLLMKKRWFDLIFSMTLWITPMLSSTNSINRYLLQSFPMIFIISEVSYTNRFTRILLPVTYLFLYVLFLTLHINGLWIGLGDTTNSSFVFQHT